MSVAALFSTALILTFVNLNCSFVYISYKLQSQSQSSPTHRRNTSVAMQAVQSFDERGSDNDATICAKASVHYSAANEYIQAHYNISQYFLHNDCVETIHDGRGMQDSYHNEREMLKENGLAIVASPVSATKVNWSERDSIQHHYLPELEKIIDKLFPEKIIHLSFWNPMMRGETLEISRQQCDKFDIPTANIASLVHIDTDIGAYEKIQDVLAIIEKNRLGHGSSVPPSSNFEDVADDIVIRRKRFAILNFWRNIGDRPVSRAPLSILSPRYDGDVDFPDAAPDVENSKWYMFPNATRDEVIIFYQYDRERSQPSDLWHCAIEVKENEESNCLHRRKSFDIRAFIVFNEEVSSKNDRFSPERTRPMLSFEESGCFCDKQAAKRTQV